MYRLTGDKLWQDKGWRMFSAWMDNALVDDGFASVSDVRRKAGTKIDNMERCARLPGLLVDSLRAAADRRRYGRRTTALPWPRRSSTTSYCTPTRRCSASTTTCSTPVRSAAALQPPVHDQLTDDPSPTRPSRGPPAPRQPGHPARLAGPLVVSRPPPSSCLRSSLR